MSDFKSAKLNTENLSSLVANQTPSMEDIIDLYMIGNPKEFHGPNQDSLCADLDVWDSTRPDVGRNQQTIYTAVWNLAYWDDSKNIGRTIPETRAEQQARDTPPLQAGDTPADPS